MFLDRFDAAHQLVPKLKKYQGKKDTLILAIPRGALEIGSVLASQLKLPLDIVVTKKIGAPGNPEYALGAVAPDGGYELNEEVARAYGISQKYLVREIEELKKEIKRRYQEYRDDPKPPSIKGKTIILIDDGIATGFTTLIAVRYLKRQKARKIILAAPVAPPDSAAKLRKEVDEFICLSEPLDFGAVGQFYQTFDQVSDQEAREILKKTKL